MSDPNLPEVPGGFDFGGLLEQAQTMMSQAQAAQDQTVEGSAGGGAVRIVATGMGTFDDVHIDPQAVDPDDIAGLEDLVLAALHDVSAKIADLQAQSMGFDLGAIGDMLGGLTFGAADDDDEEYEDEDEDDEGAPTP